MNTLALSTALYVLVYATAFVLSLGTALFILDAAWKTRRGYKYTDPKVAFSKAEFFLSLALLCGTSIGPYFVLGTLLGYYPPFLASEQRLVDAAASGEKVVALAEQVNRTRAALSNADELSIRQLRGELATSLEVFDHLLDQAKEQERIVRVLQQRTEVERLRAERAQATADELSSLTAVQLDAIRSAITAGAKSESTKGFWLGVATSFPIGVIASLCASWIFRRMNTSRHAEQRAAADAEKRRG